MLTLSGNQITSVAALNLGRFTGLTSLLLSNNDITSVSGLDGLKNLREIVLDQNKIRYGILLPAMLRIAAKCSLCMPLLSAAPWCERL